jgi:hypothetical protein
MAKGGLFAVTSPPAEDDDDDFADDALPAEDDEEMTEPMGGPFDSYAATIFDDKADVTAKIEALREAILTLIEEGGGGSLPPLPGLDDL